MRSGRIPLAIALVFVVLIGGSDAGRYVAAIRIGLTGLGAVMPNPSAGPIEIRFALREPATAAFDVLDLAGRRVARN